MRPLINSLALSIALVLCDNAWAQTAPESAPAAADAAPTQEIAPAPLQPPAQTDAPTQAEQDFNALYGASQYDPVADPTLPPGVETSAPYDPWERYNRRMHAFNNQVDRTVAKPLAKAYVAAVPRPVRLGVSNFFNNLGQPVSAVNALLQGKPKQAAQSLGRFVMNSTLGIGGIFDPASDAKIPNKSEDFGQTLGVWGWKRSRYVELPLFGPRTVRDTFGMLGDAPLSPIRTIEEDKVRVFTQGAQLVDVRAQLLPLDSLREGASDEYALFRDGWSQRRNYQIHGDRDAEKQSDLPDYLREEENNPTVPADAMPIMPTDTGFDIN
ncbi:phospholipid-binding lipoprotein MlaA [Luteimonas cucumeris]|uniref:Phospholipid-binding lipoprotein MlaA n=1 Tax=Luteimonas cucumeris TaxID=985012 RepID=A0A562KWA6_9GAMM|nr:VacJ family lipoprotein [Luteimonas cucumeris]TWH99708.1 phospholipid-binding lipoprotein MlaA [Luteimonas cucumeris]